MPKPYFNVNSLTFSSGLLSINYSIFKLRGGGTIRIDGFSNSISFTETRSFGRNIGRTFSIVNLGTSSTATTTDPSVVWTFGGTAANAGTNVKFSIRGQQLSNATASGLTLSNYIDSLVSGFSFTGAAAGFTATASHSGLTSTVTFTAPTKSGNFFNGVTVSGVFTKGASSFTWSTPGVSLAGTTTATFSGGETTYNITVNFPKLMSVPLTTITETSKTASTLP